MANTRRLQKDKWRIPRYKRQRGRDTYALRVTTKNGPHIVAEDIPFDEVDETAQLLINDPRDPHDAIYVWSVRDHQWTWAYYQDSTPDIVKGAA